MRVGSVVAIPLGDSAYASVRDEHGSVYTVHAGELPNDAEDGDDFAYRVDVWFNRSGPAATLRRA